jgi:hypothetical protein
MAIIFIEATSTSGADEIVEAVRSGSLWGVDMGTTSSAGAYADKALVDCTKTRAGKLIEECPEGLTISAYNEDPPSFSAADSGCQVWYLRGLLS